MPATTQRRGLDPRRRPPRGPAAYVRAYYNVPARRGGRVRVDGRPGVITSIRGAYLRVRLDGEQHPVPCHPTWRVEYLDAPRVEPGTRWTDNSHGNRGRIIEIVTIDTRYAEYVVTALPAKALHPDGTLQPGFRDTRNDQPKRILLTAFRPGPACTGYSPAPTPIKEPRP